jgi:hypothetical protein
MFFNIDVSPAPWLRDLRIDIPGHVVFKLVDQSVNNKLAFDHLFDTITQDI